jgi:hypothetical protein
MERKRGREGERERKHIYFHNQISPLIFKWCHALIFP